MTDEKTKYQSELDSIQWKDEESYLEFEESKKASQSKSSSSSKMWMNTVEKYLDSIEYAIDKSNKTGQKISNTLDKLPEPSSKKGLIATVLFLFLAILIFLLS